MHHRFSPKRHRFHYNVFMFYVSLDELPMLTKKLALFSTDKFNLFSFRKKEHLQLPAENPDISKSTREHLAQYLKENGITITDEKIIVVTQSHFLISFVNILNIYPVY